MKNIRILIIAVLLAGFFTALQAAPPHRVPARPGLIAVVQPEGDTIMIRIFGDEHKSVRTTSDGYVITENAKGTLCYARIKKDAIVASCRKAHDPEKRTKCEQKRLSKNAQNPRLKLDVNNPVF